MKTTSIEWTDSTWNPIRGCSRVSEGCRNCYAERVAARFNDPGMAYEGLAVSKTTIYADKKQATEAHWTGEVRFVEDRLADPLRWRKPRRVFVNSMSDLFHPKVPVLWISRIFAVMALAGGHRNHFGVKGHTFQILTKRPERALEVLSMPLFRVGVAQAIRQMAKEWPLFHATRGTWPEDVAHEVERGAPSFWPMRDVWLGTSAEDQQSWEKRTEILRRVPAALRWVSLEPMIGPVEAAPWTLAGLDWVVVGGESGPGARSFDLAWAREVVDACQAAGVPVFVKQLGAKPLYELGHGDGMESLSLSDRKGGDMSEWPADLRVRQFPGAR
jgi:protein gp37